MFPQHKKNSMSGQHLSVRHSCLTVMSQLDSSCLDQMNPSVTTSSFLLRTAWTKLCLPLVASSSTSPPLIYATTEAVVLPAYSCHNKPPICFMSILASKYKADEILSNPNVQSQSSIALFLLSVSKLKLHFSNVKIFWFILHCSPHDKLYNSPC